MFCRLAQAIGQKTITFSFYLFLTFTFHGLSIYIKSHRTRNGDYRNRFFWRQTDCVRDYAKSLLNSRRWLIPCVPMFMCDSNETNEVIARKPTAKIRFLFDCKQSTSGSRVRRARMYIMARSMLNVIVLSELKGPK